MNYLIVNKTSFGMEFQIFYSLPSRVTGSLGILSSLGLFFLLLGSIKSRVLEFILHFMRGFRERFTYLNFLSQHFVHFSV